MWVSYLVTKLGMEPYAVRAEAEEDIRELDDGRILVTMKVPPDDPDVERAGYAEFARDRRAEILRRLRAKGVEL